ncbi:MAG: outer membrane lipid asymmetry maintenance protein MlaD [Pseudomonadales bacterium]
MRMRTIEISVGAFVLAGALAFVVLMVQVSGVNFESSGEGYRLYAKFNDVAGLRVRSKVSMAGVTIGRVTAISVDTAYGEAEVEIRIDPGTGSLPIDTGARILTEGIVGARYISLMPGADEEMLGDGDSIEDTQGALVLENLIGDFITTLGDS